MDTFDAALTYSWNNKYLIHVSQSQNLEKHIIHSWPRKRKRETTVKESESSGDDDDAMNFDMEIDAWKHQEVEYSAGW